MKRILNISAAIAAVLSFAACQQTQEVSENIVNVKVVTDGIIEPEDAVKTYMGENSSTGNPEVKWNADDAIALYEFVDDAAEPTQNPTSNGTRLTDDNHIAEFNVPLNADKAEGSTYTYVAIYPDGAVSKGGSGDKSFDRVQIPAVQNAQFIGDDYSTANFDPAADVLVGVPVVRDSRPTESDYLGFSFKRVGTIGKLTLKNLWAGEVVSSVEISLPDKSKLSGYSKIDIKGGEIIDAGYTTGEKITVNVPHSAEAAMETAEDINNVICFRCLSGTWATGTNVIVKVTTDKAVYTKTTALPRDYEFVEGGLTAFSFNMSTATREEISTEDYSGSWMIVSENGGTLYAMPAYTSDKNNIPAVTYTLNGEGKATSADGLDDCQYTITKVTDGGSYDGCYTIQDANGLFLYAAGGTSSNHLKGDSELGAEAKYYWDITFAEGQYSIVAKSTGRNVMRYNSSSTLFSCYASATQTAVSLFPWENVLPAGAPVIQVSSTTLALNADGTEKADPITVTGKNLTENITATSSDESWLLAEVIDGVLDVVAEENTGSEDRSATITLSSTGASNVVIEVTQDKASSGPSGNVLTFNFVTHPNGWPVGSSAGTAGSYTYTLGGKAYTFIHSTKSGNGIYMGGTSGSSGYLMVCSGNNLGLPAIEGYRLAKVVASNTSGCSTTTKVGVSADPSASSYISGGALQTWSTQSSTYTYELEDTEENTVYYLVVTSKNSQIVSLELTYEATVALSSVTVSGEPTKKTYKEGDEFETAGLIATAKYADNSEKVVTDDVEWTVTLSPLTVGTTSVSVTASYKGVTSAAFVVNGLTVTEPATLSSISVNTAPTKVVYNEGEKFDPAGL
ncbi:MAG: bacterial Ig-like domain-containing protein, partial [Bacteroidales bacterium]|nr:bacterial Ig-like domain-containing protein [Bacteroidales bacterium]